MSAPLVRREFRARPGRLLLVLVTVVVAVAFTSGAFGFSEQLTRLLQPADDVQDALALPEGTVIVTGRTDGLSAATALDDSLLDKVRAIDGVASAQGSYDQPVAFDVPWGVDWSRPGLIRGLVITSNYDPDNWSIVEGRAPVGRSEVAVDANGAVVGAVSLGSNARLQLPIGTVDVEVVGIMAPAGAERGTGLERFDRPERQRHQWRCVRWRRGDRRERRRRIDRAGIGPCCARSGRRPGDARSGRQGRPDHRHADTGGHARPASGTTRTGPARRGELRCDHVARGCDPADGVEHRGRGAPRHLRLCGRHPAGVDSGRDQRPERDRGAAHP